MSTFFNPVHAAMFYVHKGLNVSTVDLVFHNFLAHQCVSFGPGVKTRNMNFRWNFAKQITESGEKN